MDDQYVDTQIYRLHTICGQEKVRRVLSFTPFDLVDLLLDFQRLEIVEFWFVRLKFGVKLVLAAFLL